MTRGFFFKYGLFLGRPTPMPRGAELLTVQVQRGEAYVWARVDPSAPVVERDLHVAGTGHPLPLRADGAPFLGTFQLNGGGLVFHVFDCGELES